jgi:carbon-monoxide dehydrogenase small subunit
MIERTWHVNDRDVEVAFEPHERLLDVLRDGLDLTGTKEGCGEGECGACTVVVDGRLVLSCMMLAASLPSGARILTIEGLSAIASGARLQEAFLALGAVQCGYCTPGMLLAAHVLLENNPRPTREQIREALSGNLCRCTGYEMIFEAVESVEAG